jgi:hypothetical protein
MRRRAALLAALAACVPLPAYALVGGGGPGAAGPAALSVSAGLDHCGVVGYEIVCKIDVSFGTLPNADRYTASVTGADGSVADYGDVGAGSTSLWVPYLGAGVYSVRISAYRTVEEDEKPKLLARDRGVASGASGGGESEIDFTTEADPGPEEPGSGLPSGQGEPGAGGEQGGEPPASGCSDEEPRGEGTDAPAAPLAALEAEATLPDSVDCP